MIELILIPTLGRMDKQITYNALPEKYKQITQLVVQTQEYDDMVERYGEERVLCLPEDIKKLSPTRAYLLEKFRDKRHFVFDDDLTFRVKEPYTGTEEPDRKWQSRKFTDQDFDDAFAMVEEWMDEGIVFGSFLPSWVIADINQWPIRENQRIMTNVFLDGPKIPKDVDYNRIPAAQDLDFNLQMLTRGFKNRVSAKYMVYCSQTNAEGGCSTYRTLEMLNETQEKFAALWPKYVRVKDKLIDNGPFKGKIKKQVTISHKKAYQDGLESKNPTKALF